MEGQWRTAGKDNKSNRHLLPPHNLPARGQENLNFFSRPKAHKNMARNAGRKNGPSFVPKAGWSDSHHTQAGLLGNWLNKRAGPTSELAINELNHFHSTDFFPSPPQPTWRLRNARSIRDFLEVGGGGWDPFYHPSLIPCSSSQTQNKRPGSAGNWHFR